MAHIFAHCYDDVNKVYNNYKNRDRKGFVDMDKRETIDLSPSARNTYRISDELKARAVRV